MAYSPRPDKRTRKNVKTGIKQLGGQYSAATQSHLSKRKGVTAAKSPGVSAARKARQTKLSQKVNQQAGRNARAGVQRRAKSLDSVRKLKHATKHVQVSKSPRPHMGAKAYHAVAKAHVEAIRSDPKFYGQAMHQAAKAKLYHTASKVATGGHPGKVKKAGAVAAVAQAYGRSKGYHH